MTAHDHSYIQFAFDVLLNKDLNSNSAVIACNRGLEAVNREGSRFLVDDQESVLKFDEVDAKREVNRLLAMMKTEGPWNYFITLTCNESRTFGVAPIHVAIHRQASEQGTDVSQLLQNYCILLTRAWERTVHYTWHYITCSPERPLGHIKASWMRYEFQSGGALGNRPHVHGGVTIHPEPLDTTLHRVRCSNASMWSAHSGTDFDTLVQDGVVQNQNDYSELMGLCSAVQQHDCKKANQRCMKRRAKDDSFICRVLKHPPSHQYVFEEHPKLYDDATLRRLEYLDLAQRCPTCTDHWTVDDTLRGGMWHYPAFSDEHFSPTIPRLFVLLQSSTNVQVCDRKFQISYLAKYAAGQEENKTVSLQATNKPDEVDVQSADMINVKISGQALHAANKRDNVLGREISLTEMIWYSLKFPYVIPSCVFVHASTKPPEYRAVVVKRGARSEEPQPVVGGGGIPKPVTARLPLPQWRKFTDDQVNAISAYEVGKHYLDRTSSFSVRPPELHIITKLELYLRWFVWESDSRAKIERELAESHWIDGAQRCVKIRHAHLLEVAEYVRGLRRSPNPDTAVAATELFAFIIGPVYLQHRQGLHESDLFRRFVDASCVKRTVVVFPSPTPSFLSNFFVHMLLTTGDFISEGALYDRRSLTDAYRSANLIAGAQMTEAELRWIVRQYVTEQLSWLPIGVRTFARRLQDILEGFRNVFLEGDNNDEGYELPAVTEADMKERAEQRLLDAEKIHRDNAVDALSRENIPNFPDIEELKSGTANFIPTLQPADNQSVESVQEQTFALQSCIQAIDSLIEGRAHHMSSVALIGPPGCGKTHVLLIIYCYCLSKNLGCTLTAVTSERARKLGGEHVHLLFGIPVQGGRIHTTSSLASSTLINLARKPIRYAFLKRLDVILFEEFSLLSSEMLALLDIVLRTVKQIDKFLGGVLLIATGDPCQLSPVEGSPVWKSHHIMTSFHVINMKNYVRAARDLDLQQVIEILRTTEPSQQQIQTFTDIMSRRCLSGQCVPTWNDVPANVLRIVGTKQACEKIVNNYINDIQYSKRVPHTTCTAYDEAESGSGGWSKASESVTKFLSRQCLEERNLFLHIGQILRVTYNNRTATADLPKFSQGQCCVVLQLPTQDCDKLWLKLVPPGIRNFDAENLPNEPGWDVFYLRPSPSFMCVVSTGQTKARRTQYRVAYFVSSTVHRALGETLPAIATNISVRQHEYRLWERQQLLVVLSRVPSLDNILFVTTDSNDTLLAMIKLLQQKLVLPHQMLTALDLNAVRERTIQYDIHNFGTGLPATQCGYVYMLVSVPYPTFAYVGETTSVHRRIIEHNTGYGAQFTRRPHLMPWRCLVLIYRFPGMGNEPANVAARKNVESEWHRLNAQDRYPDARTMLVNGRIVFNRYRRLYKDLVWHELGAIRERD